MPPKKKPIIQCSYNQGNVANSDEFSKKNSPCLFRKSDFIACEAHNPLTSWYQFLYNVFENSINMHTDIVYLAGLN